MIMRLVRGLLWAANKAEEHQRLITLCAKQREIVQQVLELKALAVREKGKYGPWNLIVPLSMDAVLDNDYLNASGFPATQTLRQRIACIESIMKVISVPGHVQFELVSISESEDYRSVAGSVR